jgi:ribonuclease P protein component
LLPKKYKLPSYLIPQVLAKGQRHRFPKFILIVSRLQDLALFKPLPRAVYVCVIIPAKVVKKAYKRNKIKRQYYAIISTLVNKIRLNYIVIFLAKKSGMRKNEVITKTEVETALTKLHLIN